VQGVFDTAPKFLVYGLLKQGTREDVTNAVNTLLGHLEVLLKSNNNGNGFFVGEKVTAADLAVFQFLDNLLAHDAAFLPAKHQALLAFHKRVAELPRIAAYLKSERRHKFPKAA
jgi:glutathione S-transferase